jgi:outer membrane protein assembly factor BamB
MTRIVRAAFLVSVCGVASSIVMQAQFGGRDWTTSQYDAQRTAWVRTDARLTKDAVAKGTFEFLWKAKFDNEARQLNSLTQPVLQDLLIGYRGFKTLAFVGGSADRLFSIDTDLARPYWTVHLNYSAATGGEPPSTPECPGGLTAAPSRRTPLVPSSFTGGFGGGGQKATSAVGEPGKGAAVLSQTQPRRTGGPPAAPPSGDVAPAAARPSAIAPVGFGGVDPLYVLASDGFLRTLRVSDGAETAPRVTFLPPSARASSLIWVDGLVYATTSHGCGATPNAVWALDLTAEEKKPVVWETGGAGVAGTAGPAFGSDGTLYVALGAATPSSPAPATNGQMPARLSNAVVALDRRTLKPKDWFTADGADFNVTPMVIRLKDRDLVAAAGNDGRLYLLDGKSLGGADHKTPLHVTPKYTAAGAGAALATWEDGGTRWILAPAVGAVPAGVKFAAAGLPAARGSLVAFKLVGEGGAITLEPGWQSRDLVSPLGPVVVNGMVLAVSSGEFRGAPAAANAAPLTAAQRAKQSVPAVLYVLDGATGKQLWSSGTTITSFARAGLAAGGGQVYVVTYDNHLYAFGIPMEH